MKKFLTRCRDINFKNCEKLANDSQTFPLCNVSRRDRHISWPSIISKNRNWTLHHVSLWFFRCKFLATCHLCLYPSSASLPLSLYLFLQPLETVDFNEPISPSLERRVLTTMISICESYLEQYPTKVEDDEALMMNRQQYGTYLRHT